MDEVVSGLDGRLRALGVTWAREFELDPRGAAFSRSGGVDYPSEAHGRPEPTLACAWWVPERSDLDLLIASHLHDPRTPRGAERARTTRCLRWQAVADLSTEPFVALAIERMAPRPELPFAPRVEVFARYRPADASEGWGFAYGFEGRGWMLLLLEPGSLPVVGCGACEACAQ